MYLSEALMGLPWLLQCVIRLAAAAVFGGAIGLEREHRGRSAGFRTQMLVGIGAALATLVGLNYLRGLNGQMAVNVQVDPTRVAYGVMTGIGFLGAGTIISHGAGVRGLTTAASLWCTAAVGLTSGLGLYELAACATVIVLIVLYLLAWIDRRIPSSWFKKLQVVAAEDSDTDAARIRDALDSHGVDVIDWCISRDHESGLVTVTLHITFMKLQPDQVLGLLSDFQGIRRLSIE